MYSSVGKKLLDARMI